MNSATGWLLHSHSGQVFKYVMHKICWAWLDLSCSSWSKLNRGCWSELIFREKLRCELSLTWVLTWGSVHAFYWSNIEQMCLTWALLFVSMMRISTHRRMRLHRRERPKVSLRSKDLFSHEGKMTKEVPSAHSFVPTNQWKAKMDHHPPPPHHGSCASALQLSLTQKYS
jgi:hypothetical protein